ncbi:MAG: hypothetical protein ACRCX2_18350 [Paraclostridium sp.]
MKTLKRVKWMNVIMAMVAVGMMFHYVIPATVFMARNEAAKVADYCYENGNSICGDIAETVNQYLN